MNRLQHNVKILPSWAAPSEWIRSLGGVHHEAVLPCWPNIIGGLWGEHVTGWMRERTLDRGRGLTSERP
jgi:hypothetical protein